MFAAVLSRRPWECHRHHLQPTTSNQQPHLKKYRAIYCARNGPLPLLPSGPGGVGGITSRRARHTLSLPSPELPSISSFWPERRAGVPGQLAGWGGVPGSPASLLAGVECRGPRPACWLGWRAKVPGELAGWGGSRRPESPYLPRLLSSNPHPTSQALPSAAIKSSLERSLPCLFQLFSSS